MEAAGLSCVGQLASDRRDFNLAEPVIQRRSARHRNW